MLIKKGNQFKFKDQFSLSSVGRGHRGIFRREKGKMDLEKCEDHEMGGGNRGFSWKEYVNESYLSTLASFAVFYEVRKVSKPEAFKKFCITTSQSSYCKARNRKGKMIYTFLYVKQKFMEDFDHSIQELFFTFPK